MKHKRLTRRLFIRIVALCVFGVATTVATAWLIAGLRPVARYELIGRGADRPRFAWKPVEEVPYWSYSLTRSFGRVELHAIFYDADEEQTRRYHVIEPPPFWSQCRHKLSLPLKYRNTYWSLESLTGWPFPALKQTWSISPPEFGIDQGWMIESTGVGSDEALRSLPLEPVWPYFVADVVVHNIFWWIVWMLWSAARRWWRMRRGLCPYCTYNLRHEHDGGCPECGWRRPGGASNRDNG